MLSRRVFLLTIEIGRDFLPKVAPPSYKLVTLTTSQYVEKPQTHQLPWPFQTPKLGYLPCTSCPRFIFVKFHTPRAPSSMALVQL